MKLIVGIHALVSAIPTNHNSARSAARAGATPGEVEMVPQNRNSPNGRVASQNRNTAQVPVYAEGGRLIGHVSRAQLHSDGRCFPVEAVVDALRQGRGDSRGNFACTRSASRNTAAAPTGTVPELLPQRGRDAGIVESTSTTINQVRNPRLTERNTISRTVASAPTAVSQNQRQEPSAPQVIPMQRDRSIEREIHMEDTRTCCEVGCEHFDSCCHSLAEGECTVCIVAGAMVIGIPLMACLN